MKTTKIEWTDKTWNPITGCSKYSEGCANCYAEAMARRLQMIGTDKYRNGFSLTLHENCLNEPIAWKKPHTIFICSMSDIFHKDIPEPFIDQIISTVKKTPQHRYQLLTKRSERMARYFERRAIPSNLWVGVTVEARQYKARIERLRSLKNASVRFISCEPLLSDLGDLDLSGIDWVIVGGESGPYGRQMRENWVLSIKSQAQSQGAAFFFKQWGTWGADGIKRAKCANGKLLGGEIVQQLPQESLPLNLAVRKQAGGLGSAQSAFFCGIIRSRSERGADAGAIQAERAIITAPPD
jgi:protein gp37